MSAATTPIDDVLQDLVAEYDRIESILHALTESQWRSASGAPGWTIADTVLHLAVSEEGVATTLGIPDSSWQQRDRPLDEVMDDQVRCSTESVTRIFERWRSARRASVSAFERADPTRHFRWAAAPLKPRTLATTRLAEHWAHALDITEPLRIDFPDSDRLRHIAWLGHSTLPYALKLVAVEPVEVLSTLISPDGATWTFGPADAPATISGSAGAFCRVGARRLAAEDSGLITNGPAAFAALQVLRNYAA
jgi:uncharacterized protein (TIGR03084 family)